MLEDIALWPGLRWVRLALGILTPFGVQAGIAALIQGSPWAAGLWLASGLGIWYLLQPGYATMATTAYWTALFCCLGMVFGLETDPPNSMVSRRDVPLWEAAYLAAGAAALLVALYATGMGLWRWRSTDRRRA